MAKSKPELQVKLPIPNQDMFRHITNAYGLVCQYRTANKVPHESMENWLLRMIVEGCNAMYKYNNEQIKQYNEAVKKQQEAEANADEGSQDNSPEISESELPVVPDSKVLQENGDK